MTDNRTTELLPCPFCGGEADVMLSQSRWGQSHTIHHDALGKCPAEYVGSMQFATEAEAIAAWNARAELGSEPPYDELLRCLENDWHIHASWDGLRKFWCIELTEEGVKLRDATHGTLTAEQVREAIERNFGKVAVLDDGGPVEWRDDWVCKVGINYKAIADELNARAERTCEFKPFKNDTNEEGERHGICSVCSAYMHEQFCFCPNCGRKVVDA